MRRHYLPQILILALSVIVYFAADYLVDLPPTGLVFESEVVTAIPEGDSIVFEGNYVFHATHPRCRSYSLAFPVTQGRAGDAAVGAGTEARTGAETGAGTTEPRTAAPTDVTVMADGQPLTPQIVGEGFLFDLPVTPGARVAVAIRYRLAASGHVATYVTRTANLWPRPLESARFVKPAAVKSNYHRDGDTEAEFRDFHPKDNWTVDWRTP